MGVGNSFYQRENNAGSFFSGGNSQNNESTASEGNSFGLGNIINFGNLFSGSDHKSGEVSGTLACGSIFGENLGANSNGNGAGGEITFGGFSGGGGGSCGGGAMALG